MIKNINYRIKIKACAAAGAVLLMLSSCSGGDSSGSVPEVPDSAIASSAAPETDPQTLREELVGNWGRLGETMHEFYSDNTCLIGGMFGSYDINENRSLVMTTANGTVTEYIWYDSQSPNYWSLEGDTLNVNGNQFSRIAEESE